MGSEHRRNATITGSIVGGNLMVGMIGDQKGGKTKLWDEGDEDESFFHIRIKPYNIKKRNFYRIINLQKQ